MSRTARLVLALLLSSFFVGAANAAEPRTEIRDEDGFVVATRTDLAGDEYRYDLLPGVELPDEEWVGAVLWERIGPATYRKNAKPVSGMTEMVSGPGQDESVGFLNWRRTDRYGQRWQAVDKLPAQKVTDPFDGAVLTAEQQELSLSKGGGQYFEDDSKPFVGQWTSWTHTACNGDPAWPDLHVWDGESRLENNFSTVAQKATVLVHFRGQSLTPGCSGVIVGQNSILTNGHCVTDEDFVELDNDLITVCSYGNQAAFASDARCRGVDDLVVNAGLSAWPHDINEDYAIITLVGGIAPVTMSLSTASPTYWDDFLTRNISYPQYDVNSSGTSCVDNIVTPDDPYLRGEKQFRQSSTELGYSANQIQMKVDGVGGQSGSPFFYCPTNENCDSGPRIIGLFTAWNSVSKRHIGPRVHLFSDFVESNIP